MVTGRLPGQPRVVADSVLGTMEDKPGGRGDSEERESNWGHEAASEPAGPGARLGAFKSQLCPLSEATLNKPFDLSVPQFPHL